VAGELRVGIIGMGKIGEVHARAFRSVPGAEVAAICDAMPERLHAKGDELGLGRRYADYRKLLRDPDLDAVVIATPNCAHCRTALDALRAGKHVLCEKPMALNARQARRMVEAARAAGKVLQMGMVWRYKSECIVAKEYVSKGALGDIYHMKAVWRRRRGVPGLGRWFTTKAKSGGGVMIDIGVHFLDMAMWLSGKWKAESVSAAAYSKFGPRMRRYVYTSMWAGPPDYDGVFDVEDYATGLVRFAGDTTLSFAFSWAANCPEEMYVEILGDRGGLRLQLGEGLFLFTEYKGKLATIRPEYPETRHFELQAESFVNAVRGGRRPGATAEEGLAVMALLDAIQRSGATRREVRCSTSRPKKRPAATTAR